MYGSEPPPPGTTGYVVYDPEFPLSDNDDNGSGSYTVPPTPLLGPVSSCSEDDSERAPQDSHERCKRTRLSSPDPRPPQARSHSPQIPLVLDQFSSSSEGDVTAAQMIPKISNGNRKKTRWSSPPPCPHIPSQSPKLPLVLDRVVPVSSCSEGYMTGSKTTSNPQVPPQSSPQLFCIRSYSRQDLYPTEPDPTVNPAFALSPYWPVYVSNFRLNSLDESKRNAQIATYFASKGLLTRMIFIRQNDSFFQIYQKPTMLLDMLVYFTSKADADRAIRCCDRTTYYGHILNVLPGRIPVYFNMDLTVRFKLPDAYAIEHTETPSELALLGSKDSGNIVTIAKHSGYMLFVEFKDQNSMKLAVAQCTTWIPSRLSEPVQKQRFLEQDCTNKMQLLLQKDGAFINMLPPENLLQDLLGGKLPLVDKDWDSWKSPRELPEDLRISLYHRKIKRKKMTKDGLPDNLRKEVFLRKNIFFGINQPPSEPNLKIAQHLPAKDPHMAYRERLKNKQLSFEEKFDRIRVNKNSSPTIMPIDQPSGKIPIQREAFLSTKKKLLAHKNTKDLATRNKLFCNMLRLETSLRNMGQKSEAFQCDELNTGLVTAVYKTDQQKRFSMYFKTPMTNVDLSDVKEPLDELSPVFVANFVVSDLSPRQRNREVSEFFLAEGLSVSMVYLDDRDEFYNSYLKSVKLLDMLVYFRTEDDATKAIRELHGSTYRAHRLSVFPGRKEVMYVKGKAILLNLDSDPMLAEKAIEQFLVNVGVRIEDLDSVMRYPKKAIFSFGCKNGSILPAVQSLSAANVPRPMPRMQRYTEADVKADLLRRILHDENFLNDQPVADDELKRLFATKSRPSETEICGAAVVWDGPYQKREEMNDQIGKVLVEWKKMLTEAQLASLKNK
nr:uncharacterized protein LOC109411032 [Aedes albopictus]